MGLYSHLVDIEEQPATTTQTKEMAERPGHIKDWPDREVEVERGSLCPTKWDSITGLRKKKCNYVFFKQTDVFPVPSQVPIAKI